MKTFSITVDIKAPPQRVWAVLSDVEGWPDWTPSVKRVERLDAGPLTVGGRARLRQPKLRPAIWQITKVEKGSSFTSYERVTGPWRYEKIEGAGHWMMLEKPAALNRLLLEFLNPEPRTKNREPEPRTQNPEP